MEQAVWESEKLPTTRGIKEMRGCGINEHGLVMGLNRSG